MEYLVKEEFGGTVDSEISSLHLPRRARERRDAWMWGGIGRSSEKPGLGLLDVDGVGFHIFDSRMLDTLHSFVTNEH